MSSDSQRAGENSRTQRNTDNQRGRGRQGEPSLSLSEKAAHSNQEEVIPIPENKVGIVIGKRGWRKKDIVERSGVQALDIEDCQARITGTEEQRTKAKTLIYRILSVCHGKCPFFTIHSYSFIFYLSSFLPACLPVSFLHVCLFVCLFVYLSVCQSVSQSVSQSHGLPVCRPLFRPALPVTCPALLRHTTHTSSSRFEKGLTLETSAFQSLSGGQFTLSTQLIKPNYRLYYDLVAKFWT